MTDCRLSCLDTELLGVEVCLAWIERATEAANETGSSS